MLSDNSPAFRHRNFPAAAVQDPATEGSCSNRAEVRNGVRAPKTSGLDVAAFWLCWPNEAPRNETQFDIGAHLFDFIATMPRSKRCHYTQVAARQIYGDAGGKDTLSELLRLDQPRSGI